jgi:hypothetical protein
MYFTSDPPAFTNELFIGAIASGQIDLEEGSVADRNLLAASLTHGP